jgi:hypothetical protein
MYEAHRDQVFRDLYTVPPGDMVQYVLANKNNLKAADLKSAMSIAESLGQQKTNPYAYGDLVDQMNNDPEAFIEGTLLAKEFGNLSVSDQKMFRAKRAEMNADPGSNSEQAAVLNRTMLSLDIPTGTGSKTSEETSQAQARVAQAFFGALATWQANHPGVVPDQSELNMISLQVIEAKRETPGWWWGSTKTTTIADVPEPDQARIRADLISQGADPTPQLIVEQHVWELQQKQE